MVLFRLISVILLWKLAIIYSPMHITPYTSSEKYNSFDSGAGAWDDSVAGRLPLPKMERSTLAAGRFAGVVVDLRAILHPNAHRAGDFMFTQENEEVWIRRSMSNPFYVPVNLQSILNSFLTNFKNTSLDLRQTTCLDLPQSSCLPIPTLHIPKGSGLPASLIRRSSSLFPPGPYCIGYSIPGILCPSTNFVVMLPHGVHHHIVGSAAGLSGSTSLDHLKPV